MLVSLDDVFLVAVCFPGFSSVCLTARPSRTGSRQRRLCWRLGSLPLRSVSVMIFNNFMMVVSEALHSHVIHVFMQEVGNRYGQFSLATMFPRREFTAEDLQRSLLELELTPSASIVLLPVRHTHTHAQSYIYIY